MVKIRLAQTGKRDARMYRVVVMEEAKRRNGKTIETVGYYNPTVKPPVSQIDLDRIKFWLKVGAQLTEGAQKIIKL
jgi:small subunit ribosomal protein S16